MINSLVTDSHIQPSMSLSSKKNMTQNVGNVILHNNSTLSQSKMDSVSFKGFAAARLANTDIAKTMSKAAKEMLSEKGQKATTKAVAELVSEVTTAAVDTSNKSKMSEIAKEFVEKNKDSVSKFVETSKEFIKISKPKLFSADADINTPDKAAELLKEFAKESRIAMETMPTVEKVASKNGKSIYTNSKLEKFFESANSNSAVFGAVYSAALACLLRPIVILSMPAKGSNKEDNRYSASHSIASGLTGAAFAFALNQPLAKGIKEFAKNPAQYVSPEKLAEFQKNFNNNKAITGAISNKTFDTGKKALNLGFEVLLGIPQALLTIALIPPVLKRLGIQKSSVKQAAAKVQQDNTQNKTNEKQSNVSFKGSNVSFGKNPDKEASFVTKQIAKLVGSIYDSKLFLKFVNHSKEKDNLIPALSTLKSALISGLYVTRTLKNKNLDPDRKTTLAINQASVWAVATALGFTFNKGVDKLVDKFTNNFRAANVNKLMAKHGNSLEAVEKHINSLNGGIKAAKSIVIFSTVYRFISPVLVTPIANKIGNYVEASRKAKAANNVNA